MQKVLSFQIKTLNKSEVGRIILLSAKKKKKRFDVLEDIIKLH